MTAPRLDNEQPRNSDQFRLAIEAAPTGMIMVDREGNIALVNAQVERLFGYGREELVGKPIELLVPVQFRRQHPRYRESFFEQPLVRPMGHGRALHGLRKDGSEVPIEIGLNPLSTNDGAFVLTSVVDITERERAERTREELLEQLRTLNAELEARVRARTRELSAALCEREILLQEVHHRVKNNLQVISSLINLQVRKLEQGASRDALEECQTRIQAIALIHEKLYQSNDYSRIPFSEYVRSLATNVFHASGVSTATISLDLAIEDLALAVDKAIPCGLIINELITNALKHAFKDGRAGRVGVELSRLDALHLRLVVRDDGSGLPEGIDVCKAESLGLQLVCTLAEQLSGELLVSRQKGSSFQLTFPAET